MPERAPARSQQAIGANLFKAALAELRGRELDDAVRFLTQTLGLDLAACENHGNLAMQWLEHDPDRLPHPQAWSGFLDQTSAAFARDVRRKVVTLIAARFPANADAWIAAMSDTELAAQRGGKVPAYTLLRRALEEIASTDAVRSHPQAVCTQLLRRGFRVDKAVGDRYELLAWPPAWKAFIATGGNPGMSTKRSLPAWWQVLDARKTQQDVGFSRKVLASARAKDPEGVHAYENEQYWRRLAAARTPPRWSLRHRPEPHIDLMHAIVADPHWRSRRRSDGCDTAMWLAKNGCMETLSRLLPMRPDSVDAALVDESGRGLWALLLGTQDITGTPSVRKQMRCVSALSKFDESLRTGKGWLWQMLAPANGRSRLYPNALALMSHADAAGSGAAFLRKNPDLLWGAPPHCDRFGRYLARMILRLYAGGGSGTREAHGIATIIVLCAERFPPARLDGCLGAALAVASAVVDNPARVAAYMNAGAVTRATLRVAGRTEDQGAASSRLPLVDETVDELEARRAAKALATRLRTTAGLVACQGRARRPAM